MLPEEGKVWLSSEQMLPDIMELTWTGGRSETQLRTKDFAIKPVKMW